MAHTHDLKTRKDPLLLFRGTCHQARAHRHMVTSPDLVTPTGTTSGGSFCSSLFSQEKERSSGYQRGHQRTSVGPRCCQAMSLPWVMAMPFVSVSCPSPSDAPVLHFLGAPDVHRFPSWVRPTCWFFCRNCLPARALSLWAAAHPPLPPSLEEPSLPDWVQDMRVAMPWTVPGDGSHPLCHRLPQSPPCRQFHSRAWDRVLQPGLRHTCVHTLCWPAQGTGQFRALMGQVDSMGCPAVPSVMCGFCSRLSQGKSDFLHLTIDSSWPVLLEQWFETLSISLSLAWDDRLTPSILVYSKGKSNWDASRGQSISEKSNRPYLGNNNGIWLTETSGFLLISDRCMNSNLGELQWFSGERVEASAFVKVAVLSVYLSLSILCWLLPTTALHSWLCLLGSTQRHCDPSRPGPPLLSGSVPRGRPGCSQLSPGRCDSAPVPWSPRHLNCG